jgi:hypothetical protein
MKTRPDINYEQLLPCPFCAGEASISQGISDPHGKRTPYWYIECLGCSATAESDAIWNTRKFPRSASTRTKA